MAPKLMLLTSSGSKKKGYQVPTSKYSQGLTFTQNVGRGFLFQVQLRNPDTLGKRIPPGTPVEAPVIREACLQGFGTSLKNLIFQVPTYNVTLRRVHIAIVSVKKQ
jgi:hypothetical protein